MRRRTLIAMGCGTLVWPLFARAQPVKRVPRLCFLTFDPGTPQSPAKRFEAFFDGLRELGYVNAQTIMIEYLHPDGRSDRYPELVAECLRLKPDIIAVTTTPGAHALKIATSNSRPLSACRPANFPSWSTICTSLVVTSPECRK